ncbi:MAG: hypothetical protein OEV66_12120 [Spirochaetia bacterium]|nr:hypothetical protein [Spirochaetia bacterium]
MRYGEYLLDKEIIVLSQLEDALVMQMDNPILKLGEVLLSLGYITKPQLTESLKAYIKETGRNVLEISDWVTQEEADILIKELMEERA